MEYSNGRSAVEQCVSSSYHIIPTVQNIDEAGRCVARCMASASLNAILASLAALHPLIILPMGCCAEV